MVRGRVVRWSGIALFAVLWVDLCRQLSYTWDTNEQYAYGWFVPFLALALFVRRWPTRPNRPNPQLSTLNPQPPGPYSSFQLSAFIIFLALALLPLRVIIEINQDWPLITWPLTAIVVALTLYAVHLADPSSVPRPPSSPREMSGPAISPGSAFQRFSVSAFHFSPWVLHFAFPICFILVAVQWPYRIEKGLTQNLMQIVASLTVEIIGWFGIPAIQRGNLIEISTGVLGVDEACSGIRSFQSTLMAGLFLGELYMLRWPIRLLLLGAGLMAAFLLNLCRTLLLTWQASAHGISAVDKWHDPAGFTIAIACFGVLWLLAVLIQKRWSAPDSQLSTFNSQPPEGPPPSVLGPMDSGLRTQDSGPGTPDSKFQLSGFSISAFPRWRRYAAVVGLWSLLCIVATEVWYRSHDIKDLGVFHWSVAMPETKPGFEKIELPPRSLKMLAFDLGATGKWPESDGTEWTLYFFRWNPDTVQSVIQSRVHRPDVCLPAAGLRQVSESKMAVFEAGGLKLPFRSYIYEAEGRTLHVFFCQWEDGAENQSGLQDSKQAGRLQSVLTGRRLVGQQTLELILTGYDSLEKAELAVRRRLPELIRCEAAPASPPRLSERAP